MKEFKKTIRIIPLFFALFIPFYLILSNSEKTTSFNYILHPQKLVVLEKKEITKDFFKHKPFTITFTGDILLDKSVGTHIEQHGVDYPYLKVKNLLTKSDLTVGNLETAVTTRGEAENKSFTFRSKPSTLQGLVNAGYDVVSLANNHTLDYGVTGLYDTIENLKEYGIGYTGAGNNPDEAFKAHYTKINGKKIAILGLSRVLPYRHWFAENGRPGLAHAYEYEPMLSYVEKAVNESDYTIIYIHWNKELKDYPENYARIMAKKFIDSGVDAVIGSHSHSLMGIEFYKNKPIYYSLGNFVFTDSRSSKGHETMIVNVSFDNEKISTNLIPAKIIKHQPTIMNEAYTKKIIDKLNKISYNAHISEDGNVSILE